MADVTGIGERIVTSFGSRRHCPLPVAIGHD
jgi:hypothetical protein